MIFPGDTLGSHMLLFIWLTLCSIYLSPAAGRYADQSRSRSHRQLIPSPNMPGLCRYGTKTECCHGWKRNNKGQCEAVCDEGCKHGECVGPNKCKCFPGFTGKTCSQDSRTCAMANCQYGCEEVKGEVRCLCPSSGLQLGPDGRNCIDIDECALGKVTCSFNRRCVNTFGSYYCKCQHGFELKYVNGRYDCIDINECLMTTHKCSLHGDCINTPGSYKCRCKQGYKGSGLECSAIIEKPVKEGARIVGSAKDTIKKLLAHKNSIKKNEEIKNLIPEVALTPPPKTRLQPFDYEDGIYVGGNNQEEETEFEEEEDLEDDVREELEDDLENLIDQERVYRGDVFAHQVRREAISEPHSGGEKVSQWKSGEKSIDCRFDQGTCNWTQDTEDDFDWKHADRSNGGYYMAVPANTGQKKDIGRLKLSLASLKADTNYCLVFAYRIVGEKVGRLRAYMDSSNIPVWDENRNKDEGWRSASIEIPKATSRTASQITFESERGKGRTGEISLDNVSLISGSCDED
uniref:EGF like domain multiple 6 n=1 Tax=Leptobrachium leishanense TaxID=445787 RepID=A0A8C5M282_9ANUR